MIFSKQNAGKWVASNGEKVVATGKKLAPLMKKVKSRKDSNALRFALVPKNQYFAGSCGILIR